jgi:hypothetical protein
MRASRASNSGVQVLQLCSPGRVSTWSFVYGIVRQHRGWLSVQSQVGGGSSFSVFLPASPRTDEAMRARAPLGGSDPESARHPGT